jgi:hypothetical protein
MEPIMLKREYFTPIERLSTRNSGANRMLSLQEGLAGTLLQHAVIQAFYSSTWKADLLVEGGIGLLNRIPCAQHLAPHMLAPGASVAVLFFNPTNPSDALVIAVAGSPVSLLEPWACRAIRSTAQSIPTGMDQPITFDTEIYDNCDGFTPSSSMFIAKAAGYYSAGFAFGVLMGATSCRLFAGANLYNSAGTALKRYPRFGIMATKTSTNNYALTVTGRIYMAADDYVTFIANQDSGASLSTLAANAADEYKCCAWLERLA